MTSRPPLGVQRQPARKLSGTNLSQRPAAAAARQRSYVPPSPIRKETTFHDFSPSEPTSDAPQPRLPAVQRRGGSRLKLELSHDSADGIAHIGISESPNTIDSSKPFTPSRMMPPTEPSELGDMSPHLSAHVQAAESDAPLPMPARRPRFTADLPRRDAPPTQANPPKKDARPKPYTIEVPTAAPRYQTHGKSETHARSGSSTAGGHHGASGVGYADFFPWTGNHPEDQFSEGAIRNGLFDKAPIAQTETSSAKGVLFAALKHKSGLVALSSVFTNVIGQRRHSGQITTPTTFKPPPRVTLTDTKKAAWMRDLANPAIPLRRLSRTIPHGIRGRALLDQCLSKNVSTDRAVWLAKCVGINEIRSFKRKGPNGALIVGGGESKFHKDWTIIVEQFVESVVFGFEEPEWRRNVGYAIRLATHLYAENLLDREHFLEWLVQSLENSDQTKLPMWMLLTEIYWKDLLRLRKYGRRLVLALVRHHHEVQAHPDRDIYQPLLSKLALLLNTLIVSSPDNFVFPNAWPKYRESLKTCLAAGDPVRSNAFMAINHRNEQLVASANRSQPASRHIFVRLLDATLQAPMGDELPVQCWGIAKDKEALATTLLEWCTSLYRPGIAKVFVSSRIFKHWNSLGLDSTATILRFLDTDALEEQGQKDALYHLVCELARCKVFSVPRYIRWLVAGGGLRDPRDVLPEAPAAKRLLVELPIHALTDEHKNMRAGMLRRASYRVSDESKNTDMAIGYLKQALGLPIEEDDPILQRKPVALSKLAKRIGAGSRSLKAEIGCWIRNGFVLSGDSKGKGPAEEQGPERLPETFQAVRTVLEAAEDFSMLAEVLKSLAWQCNVETLSAAADTINRHFFAFSALGIAKPLFENLRKRLQSLAREQQNSIRPLLASLACLASRIPGNKELAVQLQKDLAMVDRHNPVDACSPVSDSMALRLQDDDVNLQEEIEKNLASGTSLDRNTMDRLFQRIVQRLQSCWGKADDNQRAYSRLLTRLRIFDTQHFDSVMTKWLCYVRTLRNRPSILRIYPLLVSVGCLTLPGIFATTSEPTGGQGASMQRPPAPNPQGPQVVQNTYRTRYMQEVLQLLLTPVQPDGLLAPEECYRFSILQDQASRENAKDMLGLIRLALAEYYHSRAQNDFENLPLDDLGVQDRLLGLIKQLVLKDAQGVARALVIRMQDSHVGDWIEYLTTKLLIPTADRDTQVTFDQVLERTNEFTLPFCQVKLLLSLASNDQNTPEGRGLQQSLLDLFVKAMDKAIDARNISWIGMLSCLSPEITHDVKNRAQVRFLDLLPSLRGTAPTDRTPDQCLLMARNLLSVIDAIIRGGSMGRQPQLVPVMVDKLADMWEVLASGDAEAKGLVVDGWLTLLLDLITLHTQTFDSSKQSNEVRSRALIVCAGLIQELDALHGPDTDTRTLRNRVFDLACLLVDNVADESRAMCARALKDTTSDPRIRYIFSFAPTPGENLMLSHKDRVATPAAATAARPGAPMGGLLGTPGSLWGLDPPTTERLSVFHFKQWDILSEPTPNVGENDTSLSLGLFEARKV
ncbi:mediator of RNA polymerase II transcription subunit 12 [Echria macrotheca]|uniref:Mediator of RNA polymerase II transcription subunit 12 n=1 Tax=Echria macrotheca TaxID=438768 RepID=A0AAJ0BII1_9PEZI|nr:mediator of RNA polymerase II transcription subunit 12 [Echria macrotheca]